MDEISVKVWGVAGDGSELIKASDAQAVLSVMNMQFLALSNERDLLLSKLRTTNEYCLTNCVDGGDTKNKVIELAGELEKAKAERDALAASAQAVIDAFICGDTDDVMQAVGRLVDADKLRKGDEQ